MRALSRKVEGPDLHGADALRLEREREFVSVIRQNAHGFRLIAATTQDLEAMVDAGKFHEELFFRVAALPVNLPPLRERPEDLPLLIRHICASVANPHFDGRLVEFTPDALDCIAERALQRRTGARALRAVMDDIMLEHMYHLPELDNVNTVYVLDAKAIEQRKPLTAVRRRTKESA